MKKIMMNFIAIIFAAIILLSCGNSSEQPSTIENNKTTQSSAVQNNDSSAVAKYDRSSPEATINTLVNASNEKDMEGLSLCFSQESAGEFKRIVYKSLSEKDLNEFKEMFGNATIKSSKIEGMNALVSVKLSNRDEEISMKKENDNWVILDF
jgi:hypothetical protein